MISITDWNCEEVRFYLYLSIFVLVKQVTVTSYTYTSQYPSASMEIH